MAAHSGLLILASLCLAAPLSALAEAQPPQEQQQFCVLVANYQQSQAQYTQESNPIRRAAMRPPNPLSYEQEVRALFADHNQFRDWIGTVRFSVIGRSVALSFFPDCPGGRQSIQFGNRTPSPSGLLSGTPLEEIQTFVPLESTIADVLLGAKNSAPRVRITGNLVPFPALMRLNSAFFTNRSMGQRTYYKSRAGGMGASVANPNYVARFTSIELIALNLNPSSTSGQTGYNH